MDQLSLNRLKSHLKEIDGLIHTVEKGHITSSTMADITDKLRSKRLLSNGSNIFRVKFNEPAELKRTLFLLDPSLHLEIQQAGLFPRYYLCRLSSGSTRHVIEDIHLSPGFPMTNERFLRMSRHGRQFLAIRVSTYHDELKKILKGRTKKTLEKAADNILQYAWHVDQSLLHILAHRQALDLPESLYLSELIYLLCFKYWEDVHQHSKRLNTFFEKVYPNPYLPGIIESVSNKNEVERTVLFACAREMYSGFQHALNKLLNIEVRLQSKGDTTSLKHVLFSNLYRFNEIVKVLDLNNDDRIKEEAQKLEARAKTLSFQLLSA